MSSSTAVKIADIKKQLQFIAAQCRAYYDQVVLANSHSEHSSTISSAADVGEQDEDADDATLPQV